MRKTMTSARLALVVFFVVVLLPGCLNPNASGATYQLTIQSDGHGTVTPSGTISVTGNAPVEISASASAGWNWSTWTVLQGSAVFDRRDYAATTVTLTSDAVIQANFDRYVDWKIKSLPGPHDWAGVACSANGNTLVAAVYDGPIYTSTDNGASWKVSSYIAGPYSHVASSSDGTHLAACENGGKIHTSADGGAHWTSPASPGSMYWSAIASSSDGSILAACESGSLWMSTDSGSTWSQTSAPSVDWKDICMSSDGTHLAAVATSGEIYTSDNTGSDWAARTGAATSYW